MSLASLALLIWSAGYASTAAYAIARRTDVPYPPAEPARRRVLLVRPCSGDERDLRATLGSSLADPEGLTVRFAIARADDPAAETARAVAAQLSASGRDVAVVVTGARGPNRKADQIARVLAVAPACDVVVVADSDVFLSPGDLRVLLAALEEPGVAAAWSPPVEEGLPSGLGDVLSRSVLGATLQAFPLLAGLDPAGLVGKLVAIRREELDAVGSFAALVGYLGEDMELARRLRARGDRVVARGIASARPRGRTPREAVARYARWMGVIRSQRPHLLWTYPLLFFCAFPAGVAALLVGGSLGTISASLFFGARVAIALAAAPHRWGWPAASPLEALLGDVVLALAFAKALSSRTVSWRGRTLRIARAALEAEER